MDLETEFLAAVASKGQALMVSVSGLVVGLVVHSKDDILPSPRMKRVCVETVTKAYVLTLQSFFKEPSGSAFYLQQPIKLVVFK